MNTRHCIRAARSAVAPRTRRDHARRRVTLAGACLAGLVTFALSAIFSPALAYFHGAGGMKEGPESFSLSVRGSVKDGATLNTTLAQPLHIGLFVETKSDGIGLVPLGAYTAGKHRIHWNLQVNGSLLAAGKYAVFLEIFDASDRPSGVPPSRFQAALTISNNGRARVRMVTINYPPF